MEFTQIKETCLYLRDLEAGKHFYHELLGLPVIHYLEDKHLFLRAGTSVLLCFNPDDSRHKKSPPGHFASGKQHFAFEVQFAEYETVKQSIKDKGIKITDEVTWKDGIKSFYFNDPEGNVLEVIPDKGVWS